MRYVSLEEWAAGEGGGAKELEVGKRGVGKKCLNVRQKLGTRKKLKTLKFWKLLKRENFHNFENIIKWSLVELKPVKSQDFPDPTPNKIEKTFS